MSDVTHRGSLLGWKLSAAKHYAHRRSHGAETTETIATAITNGGYLSICCVRVPSGYECRRETGPGRMGRLCGVYVQPVASSYAATRCGGVRGRRDRACTSVDRRAGVGHSPRASNPVLRRRDAAVVIQNNRIRHRHHSGERIRSRPLQHGCRRLHHRGTGTTQTESPFSDTWTVQGSIRLGLKSGR